LRRVPLAIENIAESDERKKKGTRERKKEQRVSIRRMMMRMNVDQTLKPINSARHVRLSLAPRASFSSSAIFTTRPIHRHHLAQCDFFGRALAFALKVANLCCFCFSAF
jgi:hypothetical protein